VATHPEPKLRMNGGIPPLSYTSFWHAQAELYLKLLTLDCLMKNKFNSLKFVPCILDIVDMTNNMH
jgi:hypothetical protein